MSARHLRRAALLGCALCCAASCRQLLSIEDAETDPSLTKSSSGQGSSSGAAGEPAANLGGAPGNGVGGDSPLGGRSGEAGLAGEAQQAGEAGQAGQGPGPTESVCERYCGAVMTNCTETFAVFTSREACLAVCAYLPEGHEGDRDVNTAHCRLRAATIAKDEIPHYCPIAGPGGNGTCGSNCESLCQLREGVCADFNTTSQSACLKECAALDDLDSFSTDLSQGQYQGPHVQCRLYHVSAAATDDAEQHCLHVDGAAPCQKQGTP